MENPVLGEWLILSMMLLCSSRIFFLKYGKVDSLAVLAPASLIFSILQIFAWGADIYSVTLLVISTICYAVNFRALLRFIAGLYVDHYNAAFKVGAIFVLIFSLAELGMLIFFRPVLFKTSDFGVKQERVRLSGSFNGGFEKSFPFEAGQGEVCIISPEKAANGYSVIIVPDKSSNLLDYKPLAYCLGQKGFKVYIGEFFSKDLRWSRNAGDMKFLRKAWLIAERLYDFKNYSAQKEFYTFNIEKECGVMLDFVKTEEGEAFKPVIFIGDWMSEIGIPEFCENNKADVYDFAVLSKYEEYKTAGFGFIQQTNPTVAASDVLKLKRDSSFASAKSIAEKIFQLIPVVPETEPETETVVEGKEAAGEQVEKREAKN